MQSYRLKIKIILGLAIFIAAGMLLIDVVISMSNHKRLLMAALDKAEVVMAIVATSLDAGETRDPVLVRHLAAMTAKAGLELLVADAAGQPLGPPPQLATAVAHDLALLTRQAALSRQAHKGASGRRFGLLGWRADYLLLAKPLRSEPGREAAGVGLALDLTPCYRGLFGDQRLIFLYFLLNLVVLTFLAYQRLAKLLMNPLQRLVRRAGEYRDDETFSFLSERKGDDVAALSTSLNSMLRRINVDRRKLQDMVSALEEANRSLLRAQQEVIRAEKLASVGRLSAGIAHEIGNPVGIVLGYLELLKQENLAPGERLDFINRSIAEISRINTIIRQLLDLARSDGEEQGRVHVHALLTDLCDGLKAQPLLAGLTLELALEAEDDTVIAVADKLRQVFLNIIMNAVDAVAPQQAGTLTITSNTVRTAIKPGQAEVTALQITLADNGPGIAAEHLATVFDPFFTTKEPGKGTGLGLSVSYMIIDNAKGRITAAPRPQGGCVVTIVLPLARSAALKPQE